MFRNGDGPIRFSSIGSLPAGIDADTDYVVVDVGDSMVALERSRRRRGWRFIAKWAVARAVVAVAVAVLTGEWELAGFVWGMFTYFHAERVIARWGR